MKKQPINFEVYLKIYDFNCDPDEISNLLDKKPSLDYRTGDLIKKSSIKRKHNGWHFLSNVKSIDINDHIKYIKKEISKLSDLKSIASTWKVKIVCVMEIGNIKPTLDLDSAAIKYMSKINAGLWIDYYLTSK